MSKSMGRFWEKGKHCNRTSEIRFSNACLFNSECVQQNVMKMNHCTADDPKWTVSVLQNKTKSTHLSVILPSLSIYLLPHLFLYNEHSVAFKHTLKIFYWCIFHCELIFQSVSKSQQCVHMPWNYNKFILLPTQFQYVWSPSATSTDKHK